MKTFVFPAEKIITEELQASEKCYKLRCGKLRKWFEEEKMTREKKGIIKQEKGRSSEGKQQQYQANGRSERIPVLWNLYHVQHVIACTSSSTPPNFFLTMVEEQYS